MGYSLQLRQIRREKGLTQNDLATQIGVSERTVGGWERGETSVPLDDAYRCAEALECTPNDICGWYIDHPREVDAYSDPVQADLNGYYEAMNTQGRSALVESARLMAGSPDVRIEKDGQDLRISPPIREIGAA